MADIFDFNTAARQEEAPPVRRGSVDSAETFRKIITNFGLLPGSVDASGGQIIRCPAPGDAPGKKSGWFVYYADGIPAGAFGNWRTGEFESWSAKSELDMTPAEVLAHRHRMDTMRALHQAEREENAKAASLRACKEWEDAKDVKAHPYLQRKGVESFGLRLRGGKLLVPLHDMSKALHGLQQIDSTGEKRFTYGCEVKGHFFAIEGQGKIAICEGYATAASIHMATGWTVVAAFNAGNLVPVCQSWRKARPGEEIIVCGDDDIATQGNPGRKYAEEAAAAIGAATMFPDFSKAGKEVKATDWNDLHALSGLGEVKRQLGKERDYRVNINDWVVDASLLETEPRPQEWLVEKTFSMSSVNLLAAMGGAGKSFLTLDLALKVAAAATPEWSGLDFNSVEAFGNAVVTHGPVAMFTAEDNRNDIHRRIWSLGAAKPAHPLVVVPLPSAGGPMPFILPGGKDGPQPSVWWYEIKEQLVSMRPKLIIFDPLASFALIDLNKPEVADFTMSLFASLADETGACVLVTHHLAKSRDNIATPEAARALVRGSTAIVDRTRATYVLWGVGESQGKEICEVISEDWSRERVYRGCVAKENSGGDKSIKTFVRGANGLLVVKDAVLRNEKGGKGLLLEDALVEAVARAAESLQPFTRTGQNGLVERKAELPTELRDMGRPTLLSMVERLLLSGRIVTCIPIGGTTKNRLDIPGGPIATAQQRIQPGSADV